MSIELTSRRDITIDVYRRVAWNGETVEISPQALAKIDEVRGQFMQFLDDNPDLSVYGVNVHVGDGANRRLTEEEQRAYAKGNGSGVTFGEPLPERVTRGIVLARLSGMIEGNSAVRSVLVRHIADMLKRSSLPEVPAEGSGGAGEINPLGRLFGHVPLELELAVKEPMVLNNGHPCATSLVADTYLRSIGAIALTEEIFALVCDALGAPVNHFAPQLEQIWEDPDEQAALRRIRGLLEGFTTPRRGKQALVSVRDIPIILASAYKARRQAEEAAAATLRSASDNPLFFPERGELAADVMSNGSYHSQIAIVAIDNLARTYADLCQVCQAFIQGMYSDRVALPNMDNSCLGVLNMPGSAWADEARVAATPSVLPAPCVGQNDLPSPTFHAWNKAVKAERCLHAELAMVAVLAAQSFHDTERTTTPALASTLAVVQRQFPPVLQWRHIGSELGVLFEKMAGAAMAYSAADEPAAAVLEMMA